MLKLDKCRVQIRAAKLFSDGSASKMIDELEKHKQETSEGQSSDFENVKNELERKLAPEALADYKKVKGYRANPVAHCKGGRCGGCRMQLPSGIESQIEAGKKLVHCENCGRILIMLEEDKEEPQLKKKTRAKKTDKKAEPETKAEAQEQEV
ncbi:MAG: C4-type zinc ribbon domain-containing protein [Christensenellaceae bacterium]